MIRFDYNQEIKSLDDQRTTIELPDHLDGFDSDMNNDVLLSVNQRAIDYGQCYTVILHSPLDSQIKSKYSNLRFQYRMPEYMFCAFEKYNIHPPVDFKNFICSFNGSPHVGRQLLVAILHKFKWFNSEYCSKNFSFTADELDGHIKKYVGNNQNFYNKFFLTQSNDNFFQDINSFGFVRLDHTQNIYNLESKLTNSFVHLVSETAPTSYYPFVTEKFLYSVVTRGLFVAYGQPGWHAHLTQYYGFKQYNKIFDYRFDNIQNPIERLIELTTMLSKFSTLSPSDWHDLYSLEADTIEYNYDHYFSGRYKKLLEVQ